MKRLKKSLKNIGAWLIDRFAQLLLPTVLLWAGGTVASLKVWAQSRTAPLWVVIMLLVPASFGAVVFIRRFLRPIDFHVTTDPLKSFLGDASWAGLPAIQLIINGTFANGENYHILLLYAYLDGCEPLMHFTETLHIPPRSAIEANVMSFCTKNKPIKSGHCDVTVVFVDAGKRKYRQRVSMMGAPQSSRASC